MHPARVIKRDGMEHEPVSNDGNAIMEKWKSPPRPLSYCAQGSSYTWAQWRIICRYSTGRDNGGDINKDGLMTRETRYF